MSYKNTIRPDILDLTRKIQLYFPRDIDEEVIKDWNGVKSQVITEALEGFCKAPTPKALTRKMYHSFSVPKEFCETLPIYTNCFSEYLKSNLPEKIGFIGKNFTNWFKRIELIPNNIVDIARNYEIRRSRLNREIDDCEIITTLGGIKKVEIPAVIFIVMLANNNFNQSQNVQNIIFMRDSSNNLRKVVIKIQEDGWFIEAISAFTATNPSLFLGDFIFSQD